MEKQNNRMILVSNRLPVTVEKMIDGQFKITKSTGGLVAGLREIHQGADCIWVGHSGIYANESGYIELKKHLAGQRLIAVDLFKSEYDAFYNGASNNEIWPLFHYFPDMMETNPDNWSAYKSVNQAFAQAILAIAKPGDRIWVHDYQLMYLPELLRNAKLNLEIAYFHHIPFPSSELFRILKTRSAILDGLLGADLIGFHTYDYVRHFINSATRVLDCHSHLDEILYKGRRIKVVAQPLGVDVKMIKQSVNNYVEQDDVLRLARQIGNCTVLLGIDRLDYTKGIPERLLAYKQLLQQYPQHIGNITFIQICVPTRANIPRYSELRAKVEQLVGQINGEFGAPGYTPIQYLYRAFSQDEVIAFYKLARVAIVTPLRDGLNLVCKEYVAARDDDDGVLILSEMAGAAAEMGEALLINPYDIDQFTQALHVGLTMNAAERHDRLVRLRQRIIQSDNIAWLRSFIQHWREAVNLNHIHSIYIGDTGYANLIKKVIDSERCFIFLDYDSALALTGHVGEQAPPAAEYIELLRDLAIATQVQLTVITSHSKKFCQNYFINLPIHIVADNGVFIQFNQKTGWETISGIEKFSEIEANINCLLETYTQHVPGAYIERRQFSLTWHYHQADPIFGAHQARELSTAIAQMLENTLCGVYHHGQAIEVRSLIANKGYALEQVLKRSDFGPEDMLLTIGNDETDEDMYKLYPDQNFTIHIGQPNLFAKHHFNSIAELHEFLKKITTMRATQTI